MNNIRKYYFNIHVVMLQKLKKNLDSPHIR